MCVILFSPSVVQGRKFPNEQSVEDFIEGLGPAQMVGRQVLGELRILACFGYVICC